MAGDLSLSAHTLTWNGDVQTSGEEIILNGSDAYLEAPDSGNWVLDGDFTVEVFGAKFAAGGFSTQQSIIGQYTTSGDQRSWLLQFRGDQSPDDIMFIMSSDGLAVSFVEFDWAAVADTAYDLCVERSGTTVRIYIDGTMLDSGTISVTSFDSSSPLAIGCSDNGIGDTPAKFWNGRFKAVRITKGTARYASDGGYTVPTLPLPTS